MSSRSDGAPVQKGQKEKEHLLERLENTSQPFAEEELTQIIRNEFFNDGNPLSTEIVDAALKRIMRLDGQSITEETLQARRESMIKGVFREILGMDKLNKTDTN